MEVAKPLREIAAGLNGLSGAWGSICALVVLQGLHYKTVPIIAENVLERLHGLRISHAINKECPD